MIVSCPRCHKQYRLDTSRLNYINLPDNSGHGVQLACSNCHEQWWELKKESANTNPQEIDATVHEQPFRNLTDLSLLYNKRHLRHTNTPSFETTFSAVDHPHHLSSHTQPKRETLKQKKWKTFFLITFWSTLIFGGIITLALVAMHFDHPLLNFTSDQQDTSQIAVSVGNIQFDVKPVDEERQKIIVMGQVKNSSQLALPLHNVKLTAWGTCQQDQTPNEEGLCKIREWTYKWKQELLQPGEELTFKSAAKIPVKIQVDQVHVDVSSH